MGDNPINILLIDDEQDNCEYLALILNGKDYQVDYRLSVEHGLEFLEAHPETDIVFQDFSLGAGLNGLDSLKIIKKKYPFIQVIMLTGETKLDTGIECMKHGACDYCIKPPDINTILDKVRGAIEKRTAARKTAEDFRTAQYLALKDALTAVFNRRYFDAYMLKTFSQPITSSMCLLMIDIDHFKTFNDQYGHQMGDRVLKHAADSLVYSVKGGDFVARYGGEEFAILLHDINTDNAIKIAEKIRHKIENNPLVCEGLTNQALKITVSIGVAELQKGESDCAVLIKRSDTALYNAKNTGRNKVCYWNEPTGI